MPDSSQLVWLFFSVSGRVSRSAYFLAGLLLAIVPAFFFYRFMLVAGGTTGGQEKIWAFAFWAASLVSIWSNVALGVKRLHDFGQPGIFAASLLVPVVSIVVFVVLCFFPGDPGPNKYGPRTNAPG
ncbi:MAG TPA: DUF805 domain-containing protein [Rhizobiaceae bacterium]|nr:DUF805 domain-containing protein [Rhizobiaceae bacterium]